MKIMSIVGWSRTKEQKKALKARRELRRLKRENAKYLLETNIKEAKRNKRLRRKAKSRVKFI